MSQLIKRITKKGFTLIELMIVVAIIGILAAIAIPKFADLITKSRESSIKGSLGSIRGALTIYYCDLEGIWPSAAIDVHICHTCLQSFPVITIPKNSSGNIGHPTGSLTGPAAVTDTGGWIYVSSGTGQLVVGCTHVDTKSSTWSTW